jgi:hypothetical protein
MALWGKPESGNTSLAPAPPVTARLGWQAFLTPARLNLFRWSNDKIKKNTVILINHLAGCVPTSFISEDCFSSIFGCKSTGGKMHPLFGRIEVVATKGEGFWVLGSGFWLKFRLSQ